MTMIFVTPAQGARVRMPERGSTVMTTAGAWVPRNVHYEQLLANKDVILADPQPSLPKGDVPSQAAAASAAPFATEVVAPAPPPIAEPHTPHRNPAVRAAASKEK